MSFSKSKFIQKILVKPEAWLLFAFIVFVTTMKFFFSESALDIFPNHVYEVPSWNYIFGTDSLGRSIFVRMGVGGFNSLLVMISSSFGALFIGAAIGSISAFARSRVDQVIFRLIQIKISIPSLLFVIFLGSWIQEFISSIEYSSQIASLIFIISLTHWGSTARTVRQLILDLKKSNFVESSAALGATEWHIFKTHIWKHLVPYLRRQFIILFPICLMAESFVSFLGFGLQSPETSWGLLIQEGWRCLSIFPHLFVFPVLFVFLSIMCLNSLLRIHDDERTIH